MPTFPPRGEPIKKKEQLAQREIELQHAIRNNFETQKLIGSVERYRMAQLSILKARIHEIHDKEFQNKPHTSDIGKLEKVILSWTNKTVEDIIIEFKALHGLIDK
jgi:hypothetical protein